MSEVLEHAQLWVTNYIQRQGLNYYIVSIIVFSLQVKSRGMLSGLCYHGFFSIVDNHWLTIIFHALKY